MWEEWISFFIFWEYLKITNHWDTKIFSKKKKPVTLKFLESIIWWIKPVYIYIFTPRLYFPDKSYLCLLRQTIDLFRRKKKNIYRQTLDLGIETCYFYFLWISNSLLINTFPILLLLSTIIMIFKKKKKYRYYCRYGL